MKNTNTRPGPLLLACNLPEARRRALEAAAAPLGIAVRDVNPADFGRPVGEMCGLLPPGPRPGALLRPFGEELLVMAFLPDALTDRCLTALRGAGLGGVLKCVLTPTNMRWTLLALYGELCREREALRAGRGQAH